MVLQSPVSGTEFAFTDSKGGDGGDKNPSDEPEGGKHDRHGIHFNNIVHAVDDLGWDDSGNEKVSLPDDDNTLIEVPNGEYIVGNNVFRDVKNWGVVGLGDDVTFKPDVGRCVRIIQVDSDYPCRNILFENIEFNQRSGLEAGIELTITVSDGLEIHDCKRTGKTPNRLTAGGPYNYEPNGLTVSIHNDSGSGTINNWTDHCETEVVGYPKNSQGIFAGWSCRGTLTIKNSSIKNQGEHAIYASKAWNVHIENCELVNNVNTNCRIAGEGSYIEDSVIGFNRDADYTNHADEDGMKATKIFRWENSRKGVSGGHIKNCEIFCETDGLSTCKLLQIMGNSGGITIEDTTFRNNSDSEGVVIDPIGSGWRGYEPPVDWVRFINCKFTGNSNNPFIDSNRPGAVERQTTTVSDSNSSSSSIEWLYNYVYN